MIYRSFLLVFIMLFGVIASSKAESIVVSIKPLYGLVAKIIRGTNHTVHLLYEGSQSAHTARLRPSDVKVLEHASAVFWVGPVYESQMEKYLRKHTKPAIALMDARGLFKLKNRTFGEGKECECSHHDDVHDDAHHHGHIHSSYEVDGHVWLHPQNAQMILREIASTLSAMDPMHKELYHDNYISAVFEIKRLFLTLKVKVKPRRYISFHDFTQYFDRAMGTECVDVVMLDPHVGASLNHVNKLMKKVNEEKVDFLAVEPQFKKDFLEKLSQGKIPVKTMDYNGVDVKADDMAYETILKNMANAFF